MPNCSGKRLWGEPLIDCLCHMNRTNLIWAGCAKPQTDIGGSWIEGVKRLEHVEGLTGHERCHARELPPAQNFSVPSTLTPEEGQFVDVVGCEDLGCVCRRRTVVHFEVVGVCGSSSEGSIRAIARARCQEL